MDENGSGLQPTSKKDLAEGTFLEKWPNWIRWVLFLPAAVALPIIYLVIQTFFISWYLDIGPNAFFFVLARSFIYGGGFVYIGSLVAPQNQKVISIILLIILSVVYGAGIFSAFLTGASITSYIESVVTLFAGGYASYSIFQEYK